MIHILADGAWPTLEAEASAAGTMLHSVQHR